MVEINQAQCISCGQCVEDCIAGNIVMKDKKAQIGTTCFLCGHCVAVCPNGAIQIPEYDMKDVEECNEQNVGLDASKLLRALKFRRSIRQYLPRPVEWKKLEPILQIGRYAATAKNTQGCRFIVVQEELQSLKQQIWDGIAKALENPQHLENEWVQVYQTMYDNKRKDPGKDYLFRNAPAVLFIAAESELDAGLAIQAMELESVSLGLGMLYNGYLCRAANALPAVHKWIGAGEKKIYACALLGYPAITYHRTAPRRTGDFIIK